MRRYPGPRRLHPLRPSIARWLVGDATRYVIRSHPHFLGPSHAIQFGSAPDRASRRRAFVFFRRAPSRVREVHLSRIGGQLASTSNALSRVGRERTSRGCVRQRPFGQVAALSPGLSTPAHLWSPDRAHTTSERVCACYRLVGDLHVRLCSAHFCARLPRCPAPRRARSW